MGPGPGRTRDWAASDTIKIAPRGAAAPNPLRLLRSDASRIARPWPQRPLSLRQRIALQAVSRRAPSRRQCVCRRDAVSGCPRPAWIRRPPGKRPRLRRASLPRRDCDSTRASGRAPLSRRRPVSAQSSGRGIAIARSRRRTRAGGAGIPQQPRTRVGSLATRRRGDRGIPAGARVEARTLPARGTISASHCRRRAMWPGPSMRYHTGLRVAPEFPQLHWNLALALLLQGDYAHGWPEYEWRLQGARAAASSASDIRVRSGPATMPPAVPCCSPPSRGWATRCKTCASRGRSPIAAHA